MGRDGIFVITPSDVNLLPKVLDAATRYESRPSSEDMQALVKRLEMEPLFV